MDREELARRLMSAFLGELDEHVRSINRDLLALEQAPGAAAAGIVQTLFRSAHSLKGAARAVNVGVIESTCHQLEDILSAARDGDAPFTPETIQLVFAAADGFAEVGARLRARQDLAGSALDALLPALGRHATQARTHKVTATSLRPATAAAALPPAEAATEAPAGVPAPAAVEAPAPSLVATALAAELRGREAVVRVTAGRLDGLIARSGELAVMQRRLDVRQEEMAALQAFVAHWLDEVRALERPLKQHLGLEGGARGAGEARATALPRRAARALARTPENLRRLERDLNRVASSLARDARALGRAAGLLDEGVRRIRMLPFAEACEGLERAARDLARAAGKEVDLVVVGGDVELDRTVLEGLMDPLLHLVRNAIDHGTEAPAARRAAGKSPRARVTVSASLRGSQVEVVVADDGRGLDLDAIREQARRRKLPEARDARELARMIFLPGFSTRRMITELSGRGVGLDVVAGRLGALHGTVEVTSEPGRGTRFVMHLPLTLTTLRALLLTAGGQTFAVVGTSVRTLALVKAGDLQTIEGREMLAVDGAPVPVASLTEVLGMPARERAHDGVRAPVVVLTAVDRQVAFVVDELLSEQEIVVKNLGERLLRLRNVAGATILPDGRVALILSAASLIASALRVRPTARLAPGLSEGPTAARRRLIVADDSVTTRSLEKSILEAAGYEVLAAPDGAEAWALLQERGADLVVSDVEMPRMDGFALTAAIRGSKRFGELPVILITALESERDKARGIEVGASAYLPKSSFDQRNLLETIAQLL